MSMSPSLKKITDEFEQQKVKILKEEKAREEERRNMAVVSPLMFFSKRVPRNSKLKWIEKRISKKRKRHRELFNMFLELEHQTIKKEEMLMQETSQIKKPTRKKYQENVLAGVLEVYCSHRLKF